MKGGRKSKVEKAEDLKTLEPAAKENDEENTEDSKVENEE